MANYVSPGRPFESVGGPDYPPPTEQDLGAADVQRSALTADLQLRTRNLKLHRQLIRRRLEAGRSGGLLHSGVAQLKQLVDETGLPLLTLNEIVVRTDDLEGRSPGSQAVSMRDLVADFGLGEDPVEELDRRVTLLSNQELSTGELGLAVEVLRQAGFQASMNHVAPLGYITKNDPDKTGAEPTERKVSYVAAEKPSDRDVVVAVIDTGLSDQPRTDGWFGAFDGEKDDLDPLFEVMPSTDEQLGVFDLCAGHGTFVAGVVRQVAPHATIRVNRAVGLDGIGTDVDLAIAMVRAVEKGAQILNLSLGTEMPHDLPPLASLVALEIIAERVKDPQDVVVVAAAGNNGTTRPVYPAAFAAVSSVKVPVIAVGGLSVEYEPTAFSSRGFWVSCSTVAECVLSTFVRGRETPEIDEEHPDVWNSENPWAVWSGTSFAAPQITGAIARRCQEEQESPGQAAAWLLRQGPTLPDFGTSLEILPAR